MKHVKAIFISIILILCIFLIIFTFIKYRKNKTEIADSIKKLESAEDRIVNIEKELQDSESIIRDIQSTIEQERIDYKKLEQYSKELESTIKEQRKLYKKFTESSESDSIGIRRIEELNESSKNIIRELLKGIVN